MFILELNIKVTRHAISLNVILEVKQGGTSFLQGWWFSIYLVALGQDDVSGFGGLVGYLGV